MGGKVLFVTVGTTSFDSLISVVDTLDFHRVAKKLGYSQLTIQLGRGQSLLHGFGVRDLSLPPAEDLLQVEVYRYKADIREDINKADLIIGHAGAGTILEALRTNKKLLVVVNESLMDNHQWELAKQLENECYVVTTNLATLLQTFETLDDRQFKPWPQGNTTPLYSVIHELIGAQLSEGFSDL